ncbi:MAG TPA: hypothetical protein VL595_21810 [Pseudonocardia sp.]|jgi:hypothetical protein|nr:hypothetical protein [Pseudonocardia sp.]
MLTAAPLPTLRPSVLAALRRDAALGVTAFGLVAALSACGGPDVAAAAPPPPAPTAAIARVDVQGPTGFAQTNMTFYAAYDNDPAGSTDIAYPNERHSKAGGTGTFADPLTFATDPNELPPGTLIYYAPLRKYFVMEDECAECIDDWKASKRPRIDLWTSATTDKRVLACEEKLTPDGLVSVEINPPADHPVDTRPLFDAAGHCW